MTMQNVQGQQRSNGCGCGATAQEYYAQSLALIDPPPQLAQAVEACWQEVQRLQSTVASTSNPAHYSRELTRSETGVDVDANPYHGLTRQKLEAVIRAAYHARANPEVLLAKWAKEGSTAMTLLAQAVTQASTAANAKTLLRSSIYYRQLGVDWLTVTTRPNPAGDNLLDETDAGAPAQERHFASRVAQLVREHHLAEGITAAINGELAVASTGGTFSVTPSVRFYGLSLLLVDAVFSRFRAMTFPELTSVSEELGYMLWNMGEAAFRQFLRSADTHRREPQFAAGGQPISIERWALHTAPRANEYAQARRNAIRFVHYKRSYQPIFAPAMSLIRPAPATQAKAAQPPMATPHSLAFEEDPLGIATPAPRLSRPSAWSTSEAAAVAGGGHGSFRHAPLGGVAGDNVEVRWNLAAGSPASTVVEVVVHLHGYDRNTPDFLQRKAVMAGADLLDAAGDSRRRAHRPTVVLIPRGRNVAGTNTWLFDNLPDARALDALLAAGLGWVATSVLGLPSGTTLSHERLTLMAHSGGGAGLSRLLDAGVNPDEVVCYDSTYGGETPIVAWLNRRLASRFAATSALRVIYRPCDRDAWTMRGDAWRLISTEISARRIKAALDAALSSNPAASALAARYRVEKTGTRHRDIPMRYTAALLDDVAANLVGATPPPPPTTRPACVANDDWSTRPPQRPAADAPPPLATQGQAYDGYDHDHDDDHDGTNGHAYAAAANLVQTFEGRAIIPLTVEGLNSSREWEETVVFSRAAINPALFAAWKAPIPPAATGFVVEDTDPARPNGFLMRVRGRLVAPADLARRATAVPLVVICHGNHPTHGFPTPATPEIKSFEGYDYLQQALANRGYASISVDTNPANAVSFNIDIRMRADEILKTVEFFRTSGDPALRTKIDYTKVILLGHSRGGEAAVLAAKLNTLGGGSLGVKAVATIAPTDISRVVVGRAPRDIHDAGAPATPAVSLPPGPLTLTPADCQRYLVLYGSHDGDVSGDGDGADISSDGAREGTGFSLYDRATCTKTLVFGRGITHNRFNSVWRECANFGDFRHSFVQPVDPITGANRCTKTSGAHFDVLIFSEEEHHRLARFYVGALADAVFSADATVRAAKEAVLRGEQRPGTHVIAFDFMPEGRLLVDDFSKANPRRVVAPGKLTEAFRIVHCPHETTLFQGTAGEKIRIGIDPAKKDVRSRSALSLRVGGIYNVFDQTTIARDGLPAFTVRIETGAATGVADQTKASSAGVLPPDRPFFNRLNDSAGNVTKLHLDTVVIPLSAFGRVDLGDVRAVEVEVGRGGVTPVLVDSIAFV